MSLEGSDGIGQIRERPEPVGGSGPGCRREGNYASPNRTGISGSTAEREATPPMRGYYLVGVSTGGVAVAMAALVSALATCT